MKTCNKCQKSWPLTSEYWPVRKRTKTGLDTPCRRCCRESEQRRRENPDIRERNRIWCKEWYKRHPKSTTIRTRMAKFGLSEAGYRSLSMKQNNVCAICNKPETAKIHGNVKSLAVDHCHSTGRIRGLLCSKCNTAMGLLEDDPSIIRKMIAYLEIPL